MAPAFLAIPLSGWALATVADRPLSFYGLFALPMTNAVAARICIELALTPSQTECVGLPVVRRRMRRACGDGHSTDASHLHSR